MSRPAKGLVEILPVQKTQLQQGRPGMDKPLAGDSHSVIRISHGAINTFRVVGQVVFEAFAQLPDGTVLPDGDSACEQTSDEGV